MGILDFLSPNEAEASPIGSAFKAATKKGVARTVTKPLASRTEDLLVGTAFQDKGNITKITKGPSHWRHVHTDEGEVVPVTRDVLADMAAAAGTKQYTSALPKQGEVSQLAQAIRSLDYHFKRIPPAQTKRLMKEHWQRYRDQLTQAGSYVPDLTMVEYKGKLMNIPTEYVNVLERDKVVKGFKVIMRLK